MTQWCLLSSVFSLLVFIFEVDESDFSHLFLARLQILIPDTEDGLHGHPWGPDMLKPPHDSVAGSLMLLLTSVLNILVKHRPQSPSSPDGKLPSLAKKKQKDTFDQWGLDVVRWVTVKMLSHTTQHLYLYGCLIKSLSKWTRMAYLHLRFCLISRFRNVFK